MRNKILFFILLTFCLGLSAQHRMANTAVTEQTGKNRSFCCCSLRLLVFLSSGMVVMLKGI